MKKLLLSLLSITFLFGCCPEPEEVLIIHEGSFSFCGASGAVPTGKKITVQGTDLTKVVQFVLLWTDYQFPI